MTDVVFDIGDIVTLTGRFYSDAAMTILADPTDVVLSIRDPNRVVTTPTVTPASTGVYTYDYAPTISGWHEFNWTGTGAVVSADQEGIYVRPGINIGIAYLSVDQLKDTLTMSGTSFADPDLALAIGAASRAIDSTTLRRFWLDTDDTQVRYYTPRSTKLLQIDDLVTLNRVDIDRSGTGSFSEAWTLGTDYVLEPSNAPAEIPARPYEALRARYASTRYLPARIEQSVKITGQFGWASIPDDITAATGIIAAKLIRRSREAPFGIVTVGIDSGAAMRIARTDPDVYTLLSGYTRYEVLL